MSHRFKDNQSKKLTLVRAGSVRPVTHYVRAGSVEHSEMTGHVHDFSDSLARSVKALGPISLIEADLFERIRAFGRLPRCSECGTTHLVSHEEYLAHQR